MKRFALIGAAGYIAPRHMQAIQDTGNQLVASLDPNDSVGIIDSYFPHADFFIEFERFDRHIDKLRRKNHPNKPEFVSICSPNYLHDSHIRFALRSGCDVICEKPLVLNPWNIDGLAEIEADTGKKVYTILQLRLHPNILQLKTEVQNRPDRKYDVDLTYITSRGRWYHISWKGDEKKSGGIATNIGVHFFDMLQFIFGDVEENILHYSDEKKSAGYLELQKARVRWFLSVDENDLPHHLPKQNQRSYRCISIDGNELDFSTVFTDLHTKSYEEILQGSGFTLEENRTAIEIVSELRKAQPAGKLGDYHPLLRQAE